MNVPDVRLCCGKRHQGTACPDGQVMCCMCFERVPVESLGVDTDGSPVDACRDCLREEEQQYHQRLHCGSGSDRAQPGTR